VLDQDLVLDDVARGRLLDRFGPGAEQWCDELPERVSGYCRRWKLELSQGLSGSTSRVYLGLRDGTRPVVLKLTPDPSIARAEAIALRAWAHTGHAADLLSADLDSGALVLERVRPGTKVSESAVLPSLAAFAELLAGLRDKPREDITSLRSSEEGIEFIYGLIARRAADPHVGAFVSPTMVTSAHALARRLAASAADRGLVHGDLHLANILDGGAARGLVAIDPRPSRGDRTWDAIDIALGRVTGAAELDDRIRGLTALVPDLFADRLRDWCKAAAVLIAVQWLYARRRAKQPPDGPRSFLLKLAAELEPM
jgi:streptomycin 6-kinase